jgi:hypothetical protein
MLGSVWRSGCSLGRIRAARAGSLPQDSGSLVVILAESNRMPKTLASCRCLAASWRLSLIAWGALAASCAAGPVSDPIQAMEPAALVVAVDLPASSLASPPSSVGGFSATPAEVRSILVEELRATNASSRIVPMDQLNGDRADVIVRLMPASDHSVSFEHEGTANFLGAGALWAITWLGGLLVPDSRYSVALDAKVQVAFGDALIERPMSPESVNLTFFERNDLLTVHGLQSLVLPPFWTTDQADKTGAALTQATLRSAARQIALLLKKDFERAAASDFGCSIELKAPKNGSAVEGSEMAIELVAVSKTETPVSRVAVSVNGGPQEELSLGDRVLADGIVARGKLRKLDVARENWIRVEATTDRVHSRTLRLMARN